MVGGTQRLPGAVADLGGEDDAAEPAAVDAGGELDRAGGARGGALRVRVGAVDGLAGFPAALRTTADPAGTVTVTFLSAPEVTSSEVPWTARYFMSAEPAAKVADFASSASLKATRYSWPVFASVRLKA